MDIYIVRNVLRVRVYIYIYIENNWIFFQQNRNCIIILADDFLRPNWYESHIPQREVNSFHLSIHSSILSFWKLQEEWTAEREKSKKKEITER